MTSDALIKGVASAISQTKAEIEAQIASVRRDVKNDLTSILSRDWSGDLVKDWREQRTYRPGDLVRYKGGVWQAWTDTSEHPLSIESGWVCLQNGIDDVTVKYDGSREVGFTVSFSDGTSKTYGLNVPVPVHTGKWEATKSYAEADEVAWSGSTWRSTENENTTEPGTEGHKWLLVAQKGSQGRIGPQGERGERGDKGDKGDDANPLTVARAIEHDLVKVVEERLETGELPDHPIAPLVRALLSAPQGEKGEEGPRGPRGLKGADADPVVVADLIVRAVGGDDEAVARLGVENVERVKGLFNVAEASDERIQLFARGGFVNGTTYQRGDLVSITGVGLFVALASTTADPRTNSPDWQTVAVTASGGGAGGASSFTSLIDTPSTLVGSANLVVAVKADESGLEFVPMAAAPTVIATVPPASPIDGALWYSPTFDQLFIWDATNGYWVGV